MGQLLHAVSEFGHYATTVIPLNCDNSQSVQRGFSRDALRAAFGNQVLIHQDLCHGQDFERITVGVPRDPIEFMKEAQNAGHPRGH